MEEYKNKFHKKKAYVLGTGPSLDDFIVNDFNAVYIGMNTCYLYPNIAKHLTVLISEYYYDDIYVNKVHQVQNFRGKPRWANKQINSLINPKLPIFYDTRVPKAVQSLNNAKYVNKHPFDFSFLEYEIGYAPGITRFNGCASTAYLSSLFAAYTGVSEIILIGCDCTDYASVLIPGWLKVREYIQEHYPNIKLTNFPK